MTQVRDHGGDLDRAMAVHGGAPEDWLDLSTGINPDPYPVGVLPDRAWAALPTKADVAALRQTAARTYGTGAPIVPLAGAQAAIQLVPRMGAAGEARVLGPTYNEHAAALRAAGWRVNMVARLDELAGADLAVVVNPNNPDGGRHAPSTLLQLGAQVGRLVVDESFGDVTPGLSLAPQISDRTRNILVLRSFGKFYGLAGLRLGAVICGSDEAARLREMAGPWNVSGPALAIGQRALADDAWARQTRARLAEAAARLDQLAAGAGWSPVGGTTLFRTYDTPNAAAAQEALARHRVWNRIFPYSEGWLRLGLPPQHRWPQLRAAFQALP